MIDPNWKYLYKIDYSNKHPVTTNLLYTPLISSSGDLMCMIYDETHEYQEESNISKEVIDYFFQREVTYLKIVQGKPWAPKLLEVNELTRTIVIEFHKETLNHIIMDPARSLDKECPNWKDQLWNIIKDIDNMGYYKLALYPHCFFIKDGTIKIIDFYACIEKDNPFLERSKIEGLIGEQSGGRFTDSTEGDLINFQTFFKITMTEFLTASWGKDNPFPDFYKRLGYD